VEHRTYRISGARFGLRTTSLRFAGWLDDALSTYRIRGKADPVYSIVVPEGDGNGVVGKRFHMLYRGATQVVRSLSAQSIGRMLLGELEAIVYPRLTDAMYLKSALLSSDSRTALLPASFLTWIGGLGRHVERAGIALPASKLVAIDRASARVIPFRSRLKVPPNALEDLAQMFPSTGPPDRTSVDRPVGVDVVYSVVSGSHDPVSPASRAFTLQRLAGSLVNGRLLGKPTLRTLGDLVERAECYQLAFGHPRSMLRAIAGSLAPGAEPGRSRPGDARSPV
jgi:hypothetical protein